MGNKNNSSKQAPAGLRIKIQDSIPIDYAGNMTFSDDSSSLYLTDHTTYQIVHINLDSSEQRVVVGKRENSFPWSTKYINNCLYVTDTFEHSLTMYDTNGNVLHVFGSSGNVLRYSIANKKIHSTGLNNPREIATDSRGRVYVCDNGNSRILVLTPDLDLITSVQVPYPSDVIAKERELLVYSNERCGMSVVNETQRQLGSVETYPLWFRRMNIFYVERMGMDRNGNLLFFDPTGSQILVVDALTFRLIKKLVDKNTCYLNYMQKHGRDEKVAVLFRERDKEGNNSTYLKFIQL